MNCCMLMGETIEELRNKFFKWNKAFESKGLTTTLVTLPLLCCASPLPPGWSSHAA